MHVNVRQHTEVTSSFVLSRRAQPPLSSLSLRFVSLDPRDLPPGSANDTGVQASIKEWRLNPHGHDQGYSGMLRFFGGQLFEHPIMADYEYFLRYDSDAYYQKRATSDFINDFHQSGGTYLVMEEQLLRYGNGNCSHTSSACAQKLA